MSCRIHRDIDTELISRVEAVNGQDSQLFAEAMAVTKNEEEALNIWAYAHTPGFISAYGDWMNNPTLNTLGKSGEPMLSDVMLNLNLNNSQDLLGLKESVDVHNFLVKSDLTADSLYSTLKRAFFNKDGQFIVDRKKLTATGLYLQDEISTMMNYPTVRAKVRETINKLRNSLKGDNTVFKDVAPLGIDSDHPLNINTGLTDTLGKLETLPIEEVENYLKSNLGEFTSEEMFQEGLNALEREDIREAVLNSPESIDYIRELLKNNRSVPVFVSRDGVLVQKKVSDTVELLSNTITVNDSKVFFTETVDDLRTIPEDGWYGQPDMVLNMLSLMEQKGAQAGIDLSGLQAQYSEKSQEEIVGFLDLIDDFNIKTEELTLTDEDITEFSNDLIEFFERSEEPQMRSVPNVREFRDKNLIMLEGDINEVEVYRTDGLIKSYGNLYQRVDNYNDYNAALEEVYNNLQKDVTILPREAFKNFGLKNGYYDMTAITNPLNKVKVINSINSFVTKQASNLGADTLEDYEMSREIALMKALFNPTTVEDRIENNVADRIQSFTGDYKYLTTDFISDFYKRMLEEKIINESELWDTGLKYFTINDKGIDMMNMSPEILSQVKVVLQSEPVLYTNLVNYSLISKNENLNFLQEFTSEYVLDTIDTRRDFVTNNPKVVDKLTKDYTKLTDDTVLVKNSVAEFIRLNDGMYELTSSDNGIAIYSRLITGVNPQFYQFGLSYPIVEDVDVNSFKDPSPKSFVDKAFNVSQNRLDSTQDEMSCLA